MNKARMRYFEEDDVLHLREVNKPVVGDDEVLVRVRAASVHPDVWHVVPGRPDVLIGHDHFGDAADRIFGSLPRALKLVALSPFVSQLPDPSFSIPSKKDVMAVLEGFLEAGKLTPVIDRTYPLNEVPEAMR